MYFSLNENSTEALKYIPKLLTSFTLAKKKRIIYTVKKKRNQSIVIPKKGGEKRNVLVNSMVESFLNVSIFSFALTFF